MPTAPTAPTIAVVGAGPGLGLAIATAFGERGFSVALVSRTQEKLDALAAQLGEAGIEAAGFAADVMDPASLEQAFTLITERFGTVDVLEYSPALHSPVPGLSSPPPLKADPASIQPQIDYYLYGGIAAAEQVLPGMLERCSGTILFTTGGTSVDPLAGPPEFTTTTIGSAALRAFAHKLHQATAGTGVHVAHIPIFAWIGSGSPEAEPRAIAEHYWRIHREREGAEQAYDAL